MPKRPEAGRGLFYTRDSGGRHETTPGQYVAWARSRAEQLGVAFDGTPEAIMAMIGGGQHRSGSLFLDFGISGNQLTRPGLEALIEEALKDTSVSHVFIPRRDRLARPDDAMDGLRLEDRLRKAGLTIVFNDKVAGPVSRGHRRDTVQSIADMLDYDQAGRFRLDLASKILSSQLTLARAGFSTGGRPPCGFRRWLVKLDGTPVRELADGERVRMPGHHVAWLPTDEARLTICRRILDMIEQMPALRVAAILNAEGVPTPDAGRPRGRRAAAGQPPVWNPTTIVKIARNPLIAAVVTYGKRPQGDQLRFSPEGPRPLEDSDYREDGPPKVVRNPDAQVKDGQPAGRRGGDLRVRPAPGFIERGADIASVREGIDAGRRVVGRPPGGCPPEEARRGG